MSFPRPRAVLLTAAALAAGLGSSLAVLPTPPAGASSRSATALLKASLAAGAKQSAVHYVVVSSAGNHSVNLVADASSTKGNQTIVLREGSHVGHVNGRLVGGNVYFEGDQYGLTQYLGMPSSLAPKYAGKWIVWTSSDSTYSWVEQDFQLSTALGQISMKAPLSIGGRTSVNGTSALNLNGTTSSLSEKGKSGPATLAVAASKTPLPLRFTGKGKEQLGKAYGTVTFSKWGETISVTAPTNAIPVSSIVG